MGCRVHEDSRADPVVRQDEPDRMVDVTLSELIRSEEQRSNRKSCRVRTRALISAARGRIDPGEIPDGKNRGAQCVAVVVRAPGFVELAVIVVDDDEVAVLLLHGALVARLALHPSAGW